MSHFILDAIISINSLVLFVFGEYVKILEFSHGQRRRHPLTDRPMVNSLQDLSSFSSGST